MLLHAIIIISQSVTYTFAGHNSYAVSSHDVTTSRKRKCSFDDDKLDDILDGLEDATSTLSDVWTKSLLIT